MVKIIALFCIALFDQGGKDGQILHPQPHHCFREATSSSSLLLLWHDMRIKVITIGLLTLTIIVANHRYLIVANIHHHHHHSSSLQTYNPRPHPHQNDQYHDHHHLYSSSSPSFIIITKSGTDQNSGGQTLTHVTSLFPRMPSFIFQPIIFHSLQFFQTKGIFWGETFL